MPLRARAALGIALSSPGCWRCVAGTTQAQSSREAERKLERIKRELSTVASERRKLEGQRGDASRQLREADEQVGQTSRGAARDRNRADPRAARRWPSCSSAAMRCRPPGGKREELARLLRAAYSAGRRCAA